MLHRGNGVFPGLEQGASTSKLSSSLGSSFASGYRCQFFVAQILPCPWRDRFLSRGSQGEQWEGARARWRPQCFCLRLLAELFRHFRLFIHTQKGRMGKTQAWVDWDCVGHWSGCPLLSAATCCALKDEVRYLPVKNETLRSRKASIFNQFQVLKLEFRESQLKWSVKEDRWDS